MSLQVRYTCNKLGLVTPFYNGNMVRNNFNSTVIAICHCFYRFVQPPQSNHSFRDIRTAHIFSVAQNILCKCEINQF
nr:MAG TPA: hypothetical protein [Caudoviricetes sp.]